MRRGKTRTLDCAMPRPKVTVRFKENADAEFVEALCGIAEVCLGYLLQQGHWYAGCPSEKPTP